MKEWETSSAWPDYRTTSIRAPAGGGTVPPLCSRTESHCARKGNHCRYQSSRSSSGAECWRTPRKVTQEQLLVSDWRGEHGFFSGHPSIARRRDTFTHREWGARFNPTGRLIRLCPITFHSYKRVKEIKNKHTELHLKTYQLDTHSFICKGTCVHERDYIYSLSQQKLLFNSACISYFNQHFILSKIHILKRYFN